MATGNHSAFDHTAKLIGDGTINFNTHVFKVVACSTAPIDSNTLKSQLTATTNLSAATITLPTDTWTTTGTNDAKYDAANVTFTATGAATIKAFAVYDENATSPLDALVSWGHPNTAATATGVVLANGEKLQFAWNASGILTLTTT